MAFFLFSFSSFCLPGLFESLHFSSFKQIQQQTYTRCLVSFALQNHWKNEILEKWRMRKQPYCDAATQKETKQKSYFIKNETGYKRKTTKSMQYKDFSSRVMLKEYIEETAITIIMIEYFCYELLHFRWHLNHSIQHWLFYLCALILFMKFNFGLSSYINFCIETHCTVVSEVKFFSPVSV